MNDDTGPQGFAMILVKTLPSDCLFARVGTWCASHSKQSSGAGNAAGMDSGWLLWQHRVPMQDGCLVFQPEDVSLEMRKLRWIEIPRHPRVRGAEFIASLAGSKPKAVCISPKPKEWHGDPSIFLQMAGTAAGVQGRGGGSMMLGCWPSYIFGHWRWTFQTPGTNMAYTRPARTWNCYGHSFLFWLAAFLENVGLRGSWLCKYVVQPFV